jgi:hypothetical protein
MTEDEGFEARVREEVQKQLAERDAQREREAQRMHDLFNPTPAPAPPPDPPSPELITELREALTRCHGDLDAASKLVWSSPGTVALLQTWGAFAAALDQTMRWALVGGLLKRQRELMAREKATV